MPVADQLKWSAGNEYVGSLGFAGTTFTTVTVGTLPALSLSANPVLYVGWSSLRGAFDLGGGTYTPKLTLPDSTVLTPTLLGAFQNAAFGAPNGGLYVARIADPRIAQGGLLEFTFRLVNVLGSPTVTRDNGVVIGVLMDGSVTPAWASDGGFGNHGNVGRGPQVSQAGDTVASGTSCGTFCPGASHDPAGFPSMAWVTRSEHVPYMRVGYTAQELADWPVGGFFSSSAQACAIAMCVQEPTAVYNSTVQWDTGSDTVFGPWVTSRQWVLGNYSFIPTVRARSSVQWVG